MFSQHERRTPSSKPTCTHTHTRTHTTGSAHNQTTAVTDVTVKTVCRGISLPPQDLAIIRRCSLKVCSHCDHCPVLLFNVMQEDRVFCSTVTQKAMYSASSGHKRAALRSNPSTTYAHTHTLSRLYSRGLGYAHTLVSLPALELRNKAWETK